MSTLSAQQTQQSSATVAVPTSLDHNEILAHKISHAVNGFRAKHATATEQQVDEFRKAVAGAMIATAAAKGSDSDKKERSVRRAALLKTITEAGIHFRHHRSFVMAPVSKSETFSFVDEKGRYCEDVQTLLVTQASHTGGTTFAFTVKDDIATVAAAVCRHDENFDSLSGREIAVERLFKGQTISFPITDASIFHPDFADEENYYVQARIQLGNLTQVYGEKYLGFKPA